MSVPVFIAVRDRVTALRQLVGWLERAGHDRIVLMDQDSTWPPVLEYLAESPHDVRRCVNAGARAVWHLGLARRGEWFVVSDPDIVPHEDCPLDAVEHLRDLLERHPEHRKAGLGLYLDDVPCDMPSLPHERSLVDPRRLIEPDAYDSLIDTTFALHRPGTPFMYEAIRTGAPYLARHTSAAWYPDMYGDEDRHYLGRATRGPTGTSWGVRHPVEEVA